MLSKNLLALTNRDISFKTNKTGLSDYHKMTITVMKSVIKKLPRLLLKCREHRNLMNIHFVKLLRRNSWNTRP